MLPTNFMQWFLSAVLILSSLGVILARKPIYASLSFLLSLLVLATFYAELGAEFISVMQILVYAGAILVIFVFVIVLFQDAHFQIEQIKSKSQPFLLYVAIVSFIIALIAFARKFIGNLSKKGTLPESFGTAEALGEALYIDYFFPFEAIILIFLVAVVGALYIAKRRV